MTLLAPSPEPVGSRTLRIVDVTLLRLHGVSRSFRRGAEQIRALRDVSLDVHAGDLFAVYGQRGAGKTTLLRVAAGFDQPDTGAVTFQDMNLASLSKRHLARIHREQIGWVERNGAHSYDLTASVYVALPLYGKAGPSNARRRALAALARVGAADCTDRRWDDLSDADRVLVAIAQALVREPRVLIVDDPTAGLSIVDRERVVSLLRTAAEEGGLGVLMAVPDMPAMLHAHQVRSLSRGRLLEPLRTAHGGDVVQLSSRHRSA